MYNILVIGENKHGKSEFGNYLTNNLNQELKNKTCNGGNLATHYSTSDFIIHRYCQKYNFFIEDVKFNKEFHRQGLIDYGNLMCDADPGILVSTCQFACPTQVCVIDGVRRYNEYENITNTFNKIFYVIRPGQESSPDNFELYDEQNNPNVVVIENGGSLQDLYYKSLDIAKEIYEEM